MNPPTQALILAAGFGTRLAPYTHTVPKPLFTLAGQPILAMTIDRLTQAGCTKILVNTHHLHEQVEAFLEQSTQLTHVDIQWVYEPDILDTGGAVANVRQLLDDAPFFVVNADVVSDIDLRAVHHTHCKANALATLVLHDRPEFNMVAVDPEGWITNFRSPGKGLAFTGIQVVSPDIFEYYPDQKAFSSIPVYQALCPDRRIRAHVVSSPYWEDIGTPAAYSRTARQWIAARALEVQVEAAAVTPLAGDGSDRTWYRAARKNDPERSLVISDHGICLPGSETLAQLSAFVSIGRHLAGKGVPVPGILEYDELSGMAVLEDLGSTHLADIVNSGAGRQEIAVLYQQVIDRLITFSQEGIQGFDPAWTCQTETYSKALILDKECRYFTDAFVRGYLEREVAFDDLTHEFAYIADNALDGACQGLMHRDCQSRNIMIRDNRIHFIDFQSARLGPLQYDLASLLLDPYVKLSPSLQEALADYAYSRIRRRDPGMDRRAFMDCFYFCRLTRNLQILGAFAFLSRVKGKPGFEAHIPAALASLKSLAQDLESHPVPKLTELINSL